jgi:hypothetical protein
MKTTSDNRTMDDVLNADFRTAPTPQEVEQWRQERADLEARLSEFKRREELLRAVAKAAWIDRASLTKATWKTLQVALDEGAMGCEDEIS